MPEFKRVTLDYDECHPFTLFPFSLFFYSENQWISHRFPRLETLEITLHLNSNSSSPRAQTVSETLLRLASAAEINTNPSDQC